MEPSQADSPGGGDHAKVKASERPRPVFQVRVQPVSTALITTQIRQEPRRHAPAHSTMHAALKDAYGAQRRMRRTGALRRALGTRHVHQATEPGFRSTG